MAHIPCVPDDAHVNAPRAAAFDDTAILDIRQVTGCHACVNRSADGLGVKFGGARTPGELTPGRDEFDGRLEGRVVR